MRAHVLTWGAVLQELRLDGHDAPLVLGFSEFDAYPAQSPYFGASVGRVANRIGDGQAKIDSMVHQLDRNEGGMHHLHGGSRGSGTRLWQLRDVGETFVTLEILLADGVMGYPGNLTLVAIFALTGNGALEITYRATTDAPTLCNPAHHSYFNLDGSGDVLGHELRIAADHVLATDEALIPTGEVLAVAGSRFDFRNCVRVGQGGGRLDHNFCLSGQAVPLRPVAWLRSIRSGVGMELQTTAPGLQVYDGAGVTTTAPGLSGQVMGPHAGLALEPQIWPDAPNHRHFPQADLLPGEVFEQHNRFVFTKNQSGGNAVFTG